MRRARARVLPRRGRRGVSVRPGVPPPPPPSLPLPPPYCCPYPCPYCTPTPSLPSRFQGSGEPGDCAPLPLPPGAAPCADPLAARVDGACLRALFGQRANTTRAAAAAACAARGEALASLLTDAQNRAAQLAAGGVRAWVGLRVQWAGNDSGAAAWDAAALAAQGDAGLASGAGGNGSFAAWRAGAGLNRSGEETCAALDAGGRWDAEACNATLAAWVCARAAEVADECALGTHSCGAVRPAMPPSPPSSLSY